MKTQMRRLSVLMIALWVLATMTGVSAEAVSPAYRYAFWTADLPPYFWSTGPNASQNQSAWSIPAPGATMTSRGPIALTAATSTVYLPIVLNNYRNWTTIWSDDFTGSANTSPSSVNWLIRTGTQNPGGAPNWGTGEVETASASTANVYLDGNGHLSLKAIRDGAGNWTSGRVETQRTDFAANRVKW